MRHRIPAAALLCGLLAACSKTGQKTEDFTPPSDQARQALAAALDHWKAGNPPPASDPIPGTTPPVLVLDGRWKASPKGLQSYEIVGEDEPAAAPAPRYFKVRLKLASGPAQEVRYVVVGIDPLWVYGEKDYDALSGMGK